MPASPTLDSAELVSSYVAIRPQDLLSPQHSLQEVNQPRRFHRMSMRQPFAFLFWRLDSLHFQTPGRTLHALPLRPGSICTQTAWTKNVY